MPTIRIPRLSGLGNSRCGLNQHQATSRAAPAEGLATRQSHRQVRDEAGRGCMGAPF